MSNTTKTTDRPRALPYATWNRELDAKIAERTTPKQIEDTLQAALRGEFKRAPRLTDGVSIPEETRTPSRSVAPAARPASSQAVSDAKAKFMDDLLRERVHSFTEAQVVAAKADWRKANDMITTLKAASKRPWEAPKVEVLVEEPAPARARLNFAEITDGNYAVRDNGVVKFYRVSTSKSGYKNVQVRASDNLFMQYGKAGIAILHRIVEAGLAESRMLFAQELGCCWRCGRTLTDETSRAIGMGPDCASK